MRPHDGRAIPTFIRQATEQKPLTVFGDGSQTRSFCYVDDLVRGLILLAESGEHLPVNIGNPQEFTLLELAEKVIEVWGGAARSSSRRCRPTTRRCASRTSREPASCSAGSRRSRSTRASVRLHAALTPGRSLSRRSLVARGRGRRDRRGCVPAASASRFLQLGLFDDAEIHYGNPDKVFPVLKQLRTQLVRINLVWGGVNGVAKRRPVNPMNPNDPAYDWSAYDRTVNYAQQYGMKVVFAIISTPPWANERRGRQRRPEERARPRALRHRGGAALQRHVRRRGRPRPCRRCATGSPGTSRTTRPSCARSTRR